MKGKKPKEEFNTSDFTIWVISVAVALALFGGAFYNKEKIFASSAMIKRMIVAKLIQMKVMRERKKNPFYY